MSSVDMFKKDEVSVPTGDINIDPNNTEGGSWDGIASPKARPRLGYLVFDPKNVLCWSMLCFLLGSSLFVMAGAMFMWAMDSTTVDYAKITAWFGFIGICLYQTGCWCGVMDVVNVDRNKPTWNPSDFKWFGFELSWNWFGWGLFFFGTPFFVWPNLLVVPGVMPTDFDYVGRWVLWDLIYWVPLTIGGVFFTAGAGCSTIGAQNGKLCNPQLRNLSWWAAFLYFVGSIGFLMSAVFGFFSYTGEGGPVCCQLYGTNLSYFWGSILFLIASYLLLIDCVHKDKLVRLGYEESSV